MDRLPVRLRGPAERLRDALLTDATALAILGLGLIARGISYADVTVGAGPSRHPAEGLLTMGQWALVWVSAGVLCLGVAPWHRSVTAAVATGAGVALHLLWGISFLWQSVHENSRSWVSSIGYFMIVALVSWAVWRGSRTDVKIREVVPDDRPDHDRGGD